MERIDDVINVLKNHCEPASNMPSMSGVDQQFVGSTPVVPGGPIVQDTISTDPPPTIKMERTGSNAASSKSNDFIQILINSRINEWIFLTF